MDRSLHNFEPGLPPARPPTCSRESSDGGSNCDVLSAADPLSSQSHCALSIQLFSIKRCLYPRSRAEQGRQAIGRTVAYRLIVTGAPALSGIALFHPARDTLVQHAQI